MSKFSDYRAPKALLFAALSVFVLSFSISPALFAQDYVINDPSFGKVRKGVVVVKFHNGTNFYASSGRVGIAEVVLAAVLQRDDQFSTILHYI